tara:strand:+ start:12629 stop:13129 length:501 start_codon:yes stop_codon:yes gene_type:complete
MADKATGSISASVLSDISKMSISGNLSYEPADSGDKWVYTERLISAASEPLLPTSQPYIDQYAATAGQDTVASGDHYRWLCIKHTGTTDGSTATSEGVVLSLAGDNAAYNEVEGIFIDSGDTWVGKFPLTTQADVYAITVTVANGAPSSAGSGNALCIVTAIMNDA